MTNTKINISEKVKIILKILKKIYNNKMIKIRNNKMKTKM